MATINFNLERAFKKGFPKADTDMYRLTKKAPANAFFEKDVNINLMVNTGHLYKLKTGEKILPKYWDFVAKKAKNSYPGAFELNMVLDRLKNAVLKELRNAQITRPRMNVEEVRELIKNTVNGQLPETKPSADLVSAYDEFMQEKLLQVKPLTMKKYKTLIKTLKEFAKAKKRKLSFLIDANFDRDFKNYLIHDKGLLNNTISKYYDTLRVFCSWARQMEYLKNDDFKSFKAGRDETDVIYLTTKQVDSIYNLNLRNSPTMEICRDTFIFQIQSGQRWSDIKNLKFSDLHSVDGNTEWWLYQQKGSKTTKIVIPMTDRANEILLKYSYRKDLFQHLFHTLSNVKTNLYIKRIAKMTGSCDTTITTVKYSGKRRIEITKPLYQYITTHTARRTFITLSLQLGLRPEVAMRISGHSNLKVMQKYLKITQTVVKDEMLKAWN